MNIGDNIKRIRKMKKLSQKEVITAINMGAAQYSRIEGGKTDPSASTLTRIAQALGVELTDLFVTEQKWKELQSYDKTVMEKVNLIERLNEKEQKVIYTMLDAFIGKQKLKDALSNLLENVA